MDFLLDENVPRAMALALAGHGHDVALLPAVLRSASDAKVLAHAARRRRVLLTLDTDFGGLVFTSGPGRRLPPAVVLVRVSAVELAGNLVSIIRVLEQALAVPGVFVVIDARGARVRPLPQR